jgi:drug/metabolite transporter (DMT)-like permease
MKLSPPWMSCVLPAVVCVLLSLQTSTFIVLRSGLPSDSCNETILMWGELIKLSVAGCVLRVISGSLRSAAERPLAAIFPVLAYTAMNLLSFWALQQLSATLSVSIIQLKLLFTALFSKLILGRDIPFVRKTALVTLSLGVLGIALQKTSAHASSKGGNHIHVLAIAALVMETLVSGLTSVYMQHIFSAGKAAIWTRNVQLAVLSVSLYGTKALSTPSCTLVLSDGAGAVMAGVSAFGGLLAALATLYAGAVGKSVAGSSAIVITVCMEHIFVARSWPAASEVIPLLLVVTAVVQYSGALFTGPSARARQVAAPTRQQGDLDGRRRYARLETDQLQAPEPASCDDKLSQATTTAEAPVEMGHAEQGSEQVEPEEEVQRQRRKAQHRLIIAIAALAGVGVVAAAALGVWRLAGGCEGTGGAEQQAQPLSDTVELYDLRDSLDSPRAYSTYVKAYLSAATVVQKPVRFKTTTMTLQDFLGPGGAVSPRLVRRHLLRQLT